ncbi:hypothetical protein EON67_07210 [archaeon]|nr:MAG: hypothetical protein EON67_07210 [archaeon]
MRVCACHACAGFYSKAPSGRGAFSRTVDVERYREAMAHEYKAIDRMAASAAAAAETMLPPVSPIVARTGTRVLASIEREAPDVRAGMPKHLYDFIHTDATRPDWQRTARDMWYSAQLLPAKERRVRTKRRALLGAPPWCPLHARALLHVHTWVCVCCHGWVHTCSVSDRSRSRRTHTAWVWKVQPRHPSMAR